MFSILLLLSVAISIAVQINDIEVLVQDHLGNYQPWGTMKFTQKASISSRSKHKGLLVSTFQVTHPQKFYKQMVSVQISTENGLLSKTIDACSPNNIWYLYSSSRSNFQLSNFNVVKRSSNPSKCDEIAPPAKIVVKNPSIGPNHIVESGAIQNARDAAIAKSKEPGMLRKYGPWVLVGFVIISFVL